MRSFGSHEAKTHLPQLLSEVEKGQTITITRRGKPVAILSPAQPVPKRDARTVIEEMLDLRDQHGPVLPGVHP